MRSPFFLGAFLAVAILSAISFLRAPKPAEFDPLAHATRTISKRRIVTDVETLASEAYGGRSELDGSAWPAAKWIEGRFREMGLETRRQPFQIALRTADPKCALSSGEVEVAPGADFRPLEWSGAATLEAPLARGLAARISKHRRAVEGRIAFEELQPPAPGRPLDPPLAERAKLYQELGALGVLFVTDPRDPHAGESAGSVPAGTPNDVASWKARRQIIQAQARAGASGGLRIPAALVSRAVMEKIAGPHFRTLTTVRLQVSFQGETFHGVNIVATLPGSSEDPPRLLIGAHYDHHGRDPKDTLHPGACDNASGVAAMLEIARAFAEAPRRPRRGVVFAAFGGEELGLWGSWAFAQDAASVRHLRAMINLDMLGRNDPDEMVLVGALQSPELAERLKTGLGRAEFRTRTTFKPPSGGPEQSIDCFFPQGSDHWPLHRAGVAAVLVTCSTFPGKEGPEDVPGLIDYDKVARAACGVFHAAWRFADSKEELPPPRDVFVPMPGR